MEKKTVNVPNISCGHCVHTIEREVGGIAGVTSVEVDRTSRDVVVSWDPEATDWTAIAERMDVIHYPPAE